MISIRIAYFIYIYINNIKEDKPRPCLIIKNGCNRRYKKKKKKTVLDIQIDVDTDNEHARKTAGKYYHKIDHMHSHENKKLLLIKYLTEKNCDNDKNFIR
ncbi:unnamed protein product [Rotaria socialis]